MIATKFTLKVWTALLTVLALKYKQVYNSSLFIRCSLNVFFFFFFFFLIFGILFKTHL